METDNRKKVKGDESENLDRGNNYGSYSMEMGSIDDDNDYMYNL